MLLFFLGSFAPPPPDVSPDTRELTSKLGILCGFLGTLFTVIPVGILLRSKWSFYGGIMLCTLLLILFPIGTVLGVITIKAFGDCKQAFGVS